MKCVLPTLIFSSLVHLAPVTNYDMKSRKLSLRSDKKRDSNVISRSVILIKVIKPMTSKSFLATTVTRDHAWGRDDMFYQCDVARTRAQLKKNPKIALLQYVRMSSSSAFDPRVRTRVMHTRFIDDSFLFFFGLNSLSRSLRHSSRRSLQFSFCENDR